MREASITMRESSGPLGNPGWFKAFRSCWLFTWRTQTAARKMWITVAGLFALPVLIALTIRGGAGEMGFYHWVIRVYLFMVLPLQCLATAGSLIREELQSDTLSYLITRPVRRASLYTAKIASQLLWIELLLFVQLVLMFASGVIFGSAAVMAAFPYLLAAQVLAVIVWSSLSALFGLLTKKFIALGVLYGFIVEIGIGKIPTNINSISMVRHVQRLLAHFDPFQERFDWTPEPYWVAAAWMIGAATIFLILGALLFNFREYQSSDEFQK